MKTVLAGTIIGSGIAWCLFIMANFTPTLTRMIGARSAAQAMNSQSGKISAMMLVFVVLLGVTAGGGTAWLILQWRDGTDGTDGIGGTTARAASIAIVHLDGFTVNLTDAQANSFLRITMDLAIERMPPPTERDKPASGLPIGRIRDTILTVLAQSKADALLSREGKTELKKKLLAELARSLPELGVQDIYFTEFLVQR